MNTYSVFGRIIGIKDSPERLVGHVRARTHSEALKKARRESRRTLTTVVTRVSKVPEYYNSQGKNSAEEALRRAVKRNPKGLYESFHGVEPIRKKKVYYEPPEGELISIGNLAQINYRPTRGVHKGTEFYHKSGDIGEKVLSTNLVLATDKEGKNLYLVRKSKKKYPVFTRHGIIG